MNDSIGGAVNIFLILFFIVVISLYMAFNVNYQKAFNVKNRIIELYEEYQGDCNSGSSEEGYSIAGPSVSSCHGKIKSYEEEIGYGKTNNKILKEICDERGMEYISEYGYCQKKVEVAPPTTGNNVNTARKSYYYEILTIVEVDIPVINNLLKLSLFQVTGQTETMELKD